MRVAAGRLKDPKAALDFLEVNHIHVVVRPKDSLERQRTIRIRSSEQSWNWPSRLVPQS